MRNARRWVYSFLAVAGLWQCLGGATLFAADEIKFYITNLSGALAIASCKGPWLRTSGFHTTPANTVIDNFYSADDNFLSPYDDWLCQAAVFGTERIDSEVGFCLGAGAREVHLTISQTGATLLVETTKCPPRSLPPQALIKLAGSATNVGESRPGRSTVKLSGKVNTSTPPALDLAIVTIDALFHEVEGAEELVGGLPLVLAPLAGSEADEATYESAPGIRPKARLDVRLKGNKPAEFKLKLEKVSIPHFPQQCVPELDGDEHTTGVALRFTIDDGVALPLVVEGAVEVECSGDNPQLPTEITVQELLPITPQAPLPAE